MIQAEKQALTATAIRARFIFPALVGANALNWNVMTQVCEMARFTRGCGIVRASSVQRGEA